MKKFLSAILCAAMFLTLLPTMAFAAPATGLPAFADVKQYTDATFTDVSASAWYADSVKTVYAKGIMDGSGAARFDPQSTIPWSQAVTIAARLHAAYHGKDIPAASGPWYTQYLNYARDNKLLPAICPADDETGSTPITREGLAVLFRSVLDEADLPAVNDLPIPDLDSVRKECRDAVSEMFASGIFTGTDGGRFDPEGKATRAQVATIVARLLCPGQRSSHDSKQNPNMAGQMGNLYNGGLSVQLDDTAYYLYRAPARDSSGEAIQDFAVFARADSGEVRRLYSHGDGLDLLSVGPDGMLYFVRTELKPTRSALVRLDPKTGEAQDVYAAPNQRSIGFYFFYDGQLYVHEKFGKDADRIGRVEDGKLKVLATVPNSWENLYVDETLYCFGGTLCWLQIAPRNSKGDDHLMFLDLETGKTTSIVTNARDVAYQGATVWTMENSTDNKQKILKRFSLALPQVTETVATYSGELAGSYSALFANGSQLYYQVSGAKKLWTISPSGQAEVAATARTGYYEAASITSQGIALQGNKSVSTLMSQNIDVVTPDGERTNLCAFLGQPYCLEGHGQLTATENDASWERAKEGTDHNLLRAFVTPDGDLALEVEFTRPGKKIRIGSVTVKLSGSVTAEKTIEVGEQLPADQASPFTFVFPKGSVGEVGDMSGLKMELQIYGSWED